MKSKLKVALVGLGHGATYVKLMDNHPHAVLSAVVDNNPSILEAAAVSDGVLKFKELNKFLDSACADAVILAVPTPLHCQMILSCLEKGLHVLLEKPLCRNDAEARLIEKALVKNENVFQVAFEVRSSPLHQSILKHIRNGDLGKVTNLWYNQHTDRHPKEWAARRVNMGGKLFDCSVHYLDLMRQWAGAPVSTIFAFGNLVGKTGKCAEDLPETAVIAMEYENGVRGTFNFGEVNHFNDDASFGIVGQTGRIMGNPWYPEGAGSYELRLDGGIRKSNVVFDGNLTSRGHLGFTEQFDNFIAAILKGGQNMCPLKDALETHRMMTALEKSLSTGKAVSI